MNIFIDIGHPAHVHYLKNLIRILQSKGHTFIIVARDKEVTFRLLESLNLEFYKKGNTSSGLLNNFVYLLKTNYHLLKIALKYNPDIFFSPASAYIAQVSKLMNKPYIGFDDTEHASLNRLLYLPFTNIIITPSCFQRNLGKKHLRINSYLELFYLYPKYFTPDPSVLKILGVNKNEKYVIMRFVSWNATHDIGHSGLSLEMKIKSVNEISKYAKVFISSEGELPEDLKQYQIKIPPERMHDVLAFATLFVGEGATMASECAVLGTPAIYVNSLEVGYCTEEENTYGLVYNFRNSYSVLEKALELLNIPNLKQEWQKRRQKMLEDKIDVTAFMVWFIENYPESVSIMKENPSEIEIRFHGINPSETQKRFL